MKYARKKIYIMDVMKDLEKETVLLELEKLPAELLRKILKEYTLIENDSTRKEPRTPKEKHQIHYEIKKLREKLQNPEQEEKNHYLPFFSLFEASKEDVLKIVGTLKKEERELLYKKYGRDLTNTKRVKELTDEEIIKITHRIIRKIHQKLKKLQSGEYFIAGIEDLYKDVPLNKLQELVVKLVPTHQKTFYRNFDKDLTKKILLPLSRKNNIIDTEAKNALDRLLYPQTKSYINYKKFISRFEDVRLKGETDEELLLRIKTSFRVLTDEELKLLYKKYNEDLNNTENTGKITDEENYIITKMISRIKWDMYILIRPAFQCKPLISRFNDLTTTEEILAEIDYLPDTEKAILKIKYQDNYLGTTIREAFSEEFNHKVKLIVEKMQRIINAKKRAKGNLSRPTYEKIIALTKTPEYESLKQVIGINLAAAIMTKKYMDAECPLESISAVTGADGLTIIGFTKEYLAFESEFIKRMSEQNLQGSKLALTVSNN